MRTIAGTTWPVEDAREYIRARVRVDESGCWIWLLAKKRKGYGAAKAPRRFCTGSYNRLAHRLAYEALVGPIPKGDGYHGTCVLHGCDNPPCCNPEHLFLGTNADNVADMVEKGRHVSVGLAGERNPRARLSEDDVRRVRRRLANGEGCGPISRDLGVEWGTIDFIRRGVTWTRVLGD